MPAILIPKSALGTLANKPLQTSQMSQVSRVTLFQIPEIPRHTFLRRDYLWRFCTTFVILRRIETDFYSEQFVEFYYNQFDTDRKQLAPLYVSLLYLNLIYILIICQRDNSMLTFESASVAGSVGIVEKLSVSGTSFYNTILLSKASFNSPSHSRKSNMQSQLLMRNLLEIMAES
jgi:hypothetical protein